MAEASALPLCYLTFSQERTSQKAVWPVPWTQAWSWALERPRAEVGVLQSSAVSLSACCSTMSRRRNKNIHLDIAILDHPPLLATLQRVILHMRCCDFPRNIRQHIEILKSSGLHAVDMDSRYRLKRRLCIYSRRRNQRMGLLKLQQTQLTLQILFTS